jgi:hypothetical protein
VYLRHEESHAHAPTEFDDFAIVAERARREIRGEPSRYSKIERPGHIIYVSLEMMDGEVLFPFSGRVPQDRKFGGANGPHLRALDEESPTQSIAGLVLRGGRIEQDANYGGGIHAMLAPW